MNRSRLLAMLIGLLVAAARCSSGGELAVTPSPQVTLQHDAAAGTLRILIEGREAIVYVHGDDQDLAHYYPVRSPSGKSMTVQRTEPYPHHRSFWFGDTVELGGRRVSFYQPWYSRADRQDPQSPFRDRVRHVAFEPAELPEHATCVRARLVWEMERSTSVLDECRDLRIVPLGEGQYFLDLIFTLTAPGGDVTFVSDWVHYAWPFIRLNKTFSGDGGGVITNSAGKAGQEQTNGQVADGKAATWVDYSNTVEGETEGLAIFSHPDNEHPHGWLTRSYGCFGPRRADSKSGRPFTLARGQSLRQRVGILVHRGDVASGRVAEHYARYARGEL